MLKAKYTVNSDINNLGLPSDPVLVGTRVLCLGNELLGDDSFGYLVADQLRQCAFRGLEVVSTSASGFGLLDHLVGVRQLVVVDTIQTNTARAGTIFEFHHSEFSRFPGGSPHTIGLFETLEIAARLALPVPPRIVVFAVEAAKCVTLGDAVSPEVQAALPVVVNMIRNILRESPKQTN